MCCNCILGKYIHMYIISIFNHFKIFKKNIYILNHVPSFRRVSFRKLDWEWNIHWWCFRVWEVMRNYQQFYSEQKYPTKHTQGGLNLGSLGLPKRPWKNYWNVETGRLEKKKKKKKKKTSLAVNVTVLRKMGWKYERDSLRVYCN